MSSTFPTRVECNRSPEKSLPPGIGGFADAQFSKGLGICADRRCHDRSAKDRDRHGSARNASDFPSKGMFTTSPSQTSLNTVRSAPGSRSARLTAPAGSIRSICGSIAMAAFRSAPSTSSSVHLGRYFARTSDRRAFSNLFGIFPAGRSPDDRPESRRDSSASFITPVLNHQEGRT